MQRFIVAARKVPKCPSLPSIVSKQPVLRNFSAPSRNAVSESLTGKRPLPFAANTKLHASVESIQEHRDKGWSSSRPHNYHKLAAPIVALPTASSSVARISSPRVGTRCFCSKNEETTAEIHPIVLFAGFVGMCGVWRLLFTRFGFIGVCVGYSLALALGVAMQSISIPRALFLIVFPPAVYSAHQYYQRTLKEIALRESGISEEHWNDERSWREFEQNRVRIYTPDNTRMLAHRSFFLRPWTLVKDEKRDLSRKER